MWKNALFATACVVIAFVMWVAGEVRFLIPYKHLLLREYSASACVFLALFAVNVYAGVFLFTRRFLLKDTGRKLAHMQRQKVIRGS
ncbi:MAG: hypothetical protein NVS1B14_01690 [Vulcanimicrobiaceae bacterium]